MTDKDKLLDGLIDRWLADKITYEEMKREYMKNIPPPPPPTGKQPEADSALIPALIILVLLLCALFMFWLAVTGVLGV